MRDLEKAMRVADRFMSLTTQDIPEHYAVDIAIKISYAHMASPLDLDAMLTTDDIYSFKHDVIGINNHFEILSQSYKDCFVPRFQMKGAH